MPPVVVLVSGMPGAGKSTLARRLGRELVLPVIDRDDFKDVMFERLGWSDRAWSERVGGASFDLVFMVMRRLLEGGASFIAETNFGPRELPGLGPLRQEFPLVRWVEIFCSAAPSVAGARMARRRVDGGRHPGHNPDADDVSDYEPMLAARDWEPVGLADVSYRFDTTDGFSAADEIVAAVSEWCG